MHASRQDTATIKLREMLGAVQVTWNCHDEAKDVLSMNRIR